MALGAYAHLGRISVEATLLPRLGAAGVLALADETHGWEEFMGALSAGRGALLVGGHLGNWEYAAAYMVARGARMEAIVRHMSNPRVEEYLNTARGRSGIGVVPDERAVRQTPRSIAGGVSVAFLADQGVAGLASTFVPFFGRMAKTPRGAAVFALRLQAPLFFFVAIRKPTGRYLFAVERVAVTPTGDRERDVDAIVVAYTRRLEQWVRRYPDQYFWHHRRWKHAPPETQRAATADAATAPHLGNDDAAAAHATRPSHGVT
jgi:KDO2-lipid IV(A) lauroyltransferase